MVYILSPFLREPIPAHLGQFYGLIDEAEVKRPKKGDDGAELVYDFDHCVTESRKYVNGLDPKVTGGLGEKIIEALQNIPPDEKQEITFAFPIRPKNEGERQQQVSHSLCIAMADFYAAKYPNVTFSIMPFYQMQDQRRTRNTVRRKEDATVDTKLGFSNRGRFVVHNEASLEGRVIIPVDNGVESGGTFAEMVSCIIRHGGMVPVVVAPYLAWDDKFAQQPETQEKFEKAFNREQRMTLDRNLQRFGLSAKTLTDIEMSYITGLGFEKTMEGIKGLKVNDADLTVSKFVNIAKSHGQLTR